MKKERGSYVKVLDTDMKTFVHHDQNKCCWTNLVGGHFITLPLGSNIIDLSFNGPPRNVPVVRVVNLTVISPLSPPKSSSLLLLVSRSIGVNALGIASNGEEALLDSPSLLLLTSFDNPDSLNMIRKSCALYSGNQKL